jgi:hypothetical protein
MSIYSNYWSTTNPVVAYRPPVNNKESNVSNYVKSVLTNGHLCKRSSILSD